MGTTLREILLAHAEEHPDRGCVRCVFPDRNCEELTYGSLVSRGSQLAEWTLQSGAQPRDAVLVILPHSPDLYCAFFGAM